MSQEQVERTDDWSWDPFSEMENLQKEMSNLFGSTLSGTSTADMTLLSGRWAPPINVYDSKDNLKRKKGTLFKVLKFQKIKIEL